MQLVSQKVCTPWTTMPIVHCKERTSWPVVTHLVLRLDNVQDDTDSILVVVPDHALMSVSCIGDHDTVLLRGKLGCMIRINKLHYLLFFHSHILGVLSSSDIHSSVLNDIIFGLTDNFRSGRLGTGLLLLGLLRLLIGLDSVFVLSKIVIRVLVAHLIISGLEIRFLIGS
jgi:hypothetical protein